MNIHDFWLFAVTALLLNITPGNDMLFVIARSTSQGARAGVVCALGIMAGCMVHIIAAVIGLSAVIAGSAIAFDVIKYIGAAYLVYLGVKSLLEKGKRLQIDGNARQQPYKKLFWQGAVTNVLNPKVALFFLAFLPQFVDIHLPGTQWQILFLGAWFNVSGTLVNISIALLFGRIGRWLHRSPRYVQWQQRFTGAVLIALGVRVATSSAK